VARKILGHSNLSMPQKYLDLMLEEVKEEYERREL
jgi:hypothetical protein